jgi:Fe-S-cluster-containing dehydrogenase component
MDKENLRNPAAITRACESQEQRNERRRSNALRQRLARLQVTDTFRTRKQQRSQVYRALARTSLLHLAFEYEVDIDYSSHSKIVIGAMNKQCQHCRAPKCTGVNRPVSAARLENPEKITIFYSTEKNKIFLRL